jgi:hypothetical protein
MNRKYIVSIPELIRIIMFRNPGDFFNDLFWLPPPVGKSKNRMATPFADIWTTTSRY